jgi:ParB family chromosome partitioning protein
MLYFAHMTEFENNAIFWVEVEKIKPNPYQPRKEFDEGHLQDLADSIRQYGILQPLVVTRREVPHDAGLLVEYELIAGERRLRASKIAGVSRVPVLIQQGFIDPRLKLELAIIENLQREDLNPVDRAISFSRLAVEFSLKHIEIAKKVGKSREYVSNSLRLLVLPQEILDALSKGKITEGHARPLMMLSDRAEEQGTLYKEIIFKKLTVREAEQIARHIAHDRVRKKVAHDPEIERIEKEFAESLGTRVSIERRSVGGKLVIDYFSSEDLRALLDRVHVAEALKSVRSMREEEMKTASEMVAIEDSTPIALSATADAPEELVLAISEETPAPQEEIQEDLVHTIDQDALLEAPYDDRSREEQKIASNEEDDDLYSVTGFSV